MPQKKSRPPSVKYFPLGSSGMMTDASCSMKTFLSEIDNLSMPSRGL